MISIVYRSGLIRIPPQRNGYKSVIAIEEIKRIAGTSYTHHNGTLMLTQTSQGNLQPPVDAKYIQKCQFQLQQQTLKLIS